MRFQAPRGTEDVLPDRSHIWQWIEHEFRSLTHAYGYREIRTPVFEDTELFIRTAGETSDVVSKEMYEFKDKGDRSLTLKPESTAPAMRALVEHNLCPQGTTARLCYVSSAHYRYDRPQKGRLREHHQCGVELVGSPSAAADAEVIEVAVRFLQRLGLSDVTVRLNSIGREACRQAYRQVLLDHARSYLEQASEEIQGKAEKNPLRLLDSKDPAAQALMASAPPITDYLEPESQAHFAEVQALLTAAGIPFSIAPEIVRGLDYYTDTVFEVLSSHLGAQSAMCGGGRYDHLIKELGGAPLPSVGFGMGVERLILVLESLEKLPGAPRPKVFIAYHGEAVRAEAFALVRELRSQGLAVLTDVDARSLKSQLRQADKSGAEYVVVLGEDEIASRTLTLKAMDSGEERPIPMLELAEALG